MKRMKILLCANVSDGRVGSGINYMNFFSHFGEVILVGPDNDLKDMIEMGDVLALPGGADVAPERYGEIPDWKCGRPDNQLEFLDKNLLEPWLKTGKPVIGICRGLQTLNVACGGSLWQDLWHHVGGEDRTALGHKLHINYNGVKDVIGCNSYHHQGIKDLAPEFVGIGWSLLDGNCPTILHNKLYLHRHIRNKENYKVVISKDTYSALYEVIKHKTKPWVAFQYHPEDYNCAFAIKVVKDTLKTYNPKFELQPAKYKIMGVAGGVYKEV